MLKSYEKMSPSIKYLFKKMSESIGVDVKSIDFTKKRFFLEHNWNVGQLNNFRNCLTNELKLNKRLKRDLLKLMKLSLITKNKKLSAEFLFTYGWEVFYNKEVEEMYF